ASPGELLQVFGTSPLRLSPAAPPDTPTDAPLAAAPSKLSMLLGLPLADLTLDAMPKHTHDAPAAALRQLNAALLPAMQLVHTPEGAPPPAAPEGLATISAPVRGDSGSLGALHLLMPRDEEESAARHFLSQLAHVLAKLMQLQERHNQLQKLAI